MNQLFRIAVPSNNPGGLEATRSDHFGHCDLFTIVDIKDNEIAAVEAVINQDHEAGGCMVPVTILSDKGVKAIVVGGIGARPLQGFSEAGITVYFADQSAVASVKKVAEGIIAGQFPIIHPDQACKGHSNCH